MLNRCAKEVSRKFPRSFKSGFRKIQGYFKKVSRVFQIIFPWVSRVLERSSKTILENFQWRFKKVSRVFQESFKSVQ